MASTKEFFDSPDSLHGLAKKVMLYRYLQGRFSELLQHRKNRSRYQFIYFDAFSGTGKYEGESEVDPRDIPFRHPSYGSPIVALDALFSAMEQGSTSSEVLLIFEDKNNEYIDQLKENVMSYVTERRDEQQGTSVEGERKFLNIDISINENGKFICKVRNQMGKSFSVEVQCLHSSFEEFDIERNMPPDFSMTPVMTFIDPFGYKDIPMARIQTFIGYRKDILITFMTSFIIRFCNLYPQIINQLFGTESPQQWRERHNYDSFYQQRLREIGNNVISEQRSLKTLSFYMKRSEGRIIYHMIFLTDELRCLQHMKYAMCTAKDTNTKLSFTDSLFNAECPTFHLATNVKEEADFIYDTWKGKTCKFGEMKEWILIYSPFQYHSGALRELEKEGKLTVETRGDERKRKALPPYVGVNNDDIDHNSKRPYRNNWIITFKGDINETPNEIRHNGSGFDGKRAQRQLQF